MWIIHNLTTDTTDVCMDVHVSTDLLVSFDSYPTDSNIPNVFL